MLAFIVKMRIMRAFFSRTRVKLNRVFCESRKFWNCSQNRRVGPLFLDTKLREPADELQLAVVQGRDLHGDSGPLAHQPQSPPECVCCALESSDREKQANSRIDPHEILVDVVLTSSVDSFVKKKKECESPPSA